MLSRLPPFIFLCLSDMVLCLFACFKRFIMSTVQKQSWAFTFEHSCQKQTDGETIQWWDGEGGSMSRRMRFFRYPRQENFLISVRSLHASWQALKTQHHYVMHSRTIFLLIIHTNRRVWIHPLLMLLVIVFEFTLYKYDVSLNGIYYAKTYFSVCTKKTKKTLRFCTTS